MRLISDTKQTRVFNRSRENIYSLYKTVHKYVVSKIYYLKESNMFILCIKLLKKYIFIMLQKIYFK